MSVSHVTQASSASNVTVIHKTVEPKKITKESLVNGVIVAIVVLLLAGILASYFVKNLPDVFVDIADISKQALWVFVGGYAIGELLKIVFINKAHVSEEYVTAKAEAESALKKIVDEGKADKIEAYCAEYAQCLYEENQRLALAGSNVSYETFKSKYVALNKRELVAKYPDENLSKSQLKAIGRANAVKKERYDPEFLMVTGDGAYQNVPSKRYNARARKMTNTIVSAALGAVGSFFGISFAYELVFEFSREILVAALIKIVLLALTVTLKLIFANSLVFDTEIGRFELQKAEANAYLRWYK